MVTIEVRALKAALNFIPKTGGKTPALEGLNVQTIGGSIAITSTDGVGMFCAKVLRDGHAPFCVTIPTDAVKAAIKLAARRLKIELDEAACVLGGVGFLPVGLNYPDPSKIIPQAIYSAPTPTYIAPPRAMKAHEAMTEFGAAYDVYLRGLESVVYKHRTAPVVCVVMPLVVPVQPKYEFRF